MEIDIENIYEIPKRKYDIWDYESSTISNIDLEYNDFFKDFMLKNIPCIVKNISSTWECTNKWIQNGLINFDYFVEEYGDIEAPVANCNNTTIDSQCKSMMSIEQYMSYLKSDRGEKLLYLKDWHLKRCRPNDSFYTVPHFFASDWLNEFALDNKQDDFMFVYIGPKKSWTPLHSDVYNSFSWSVNVVGKKKWTFFPPGEEEKLKDNFGNVPLMFQPEKYENIQYYEIIQEQGDAIFVPSGWYHQVVNEIDTISINHNWVNGCNIDIVWDALLQSLLSVEKEIIEFKDTPEYSTQCQLILKSLFGMDLTSFVNFVCYIGKKRLSQLKTDCHVFNSYYLGKLQIKFDLKSVFHVMTLIETHPQCQNLSLDYDFDTIKTTISNTIK